MILLVQTAVYTIYAVVSLLLLYTIASVLFGYQIRGSVPQFLGGFVLQILSMGIGNFMFDLQCYFFLI